MLMCMDQGGTGHAEKRLGKADHLGPGHPAQVSHLHAIGAAGLSAIGMFDGLLANSCSALLSGDPLTAQEVQEKLWDTSQGWHRATVLANGGVNNKVSFLQSAFFQDNYAANKHMQDVEWWPAWRDTMMARL